MALTDSKRITEIIYQWYLIRVPGATNGTPLGTLQMTYWKSIATNFIPSTTKTLDEAERVWLRNIIVAQGRTPSRGSASQLWFEAVSSFGIVGAFSKKDAQRLFYNSVASGTNP